MSLQMHIAHIDHRWRPESQQEAQQLSLLAAKYSLPFHLRTLDPTSLTLETAVQDDKVMQDFELESLLMGGDHSQKVKPPPIRRGYG
jgi:hypothetical protein